MKIAKACSPIALACAVLLSAQAPPASRQDNVKEVFHGVSMVDPFHWLEDAASTETRQWIGRQNEYAHALLDRQPARAPIMRRLTEMLRHDRIGEPEFRNGYYFFERRGVDADLWSIYRRKGASGTDELLIDPSPLSADHRTSVSLLGVSEDANFLAYAVRQGGEDETEIHTFDTRSRQDVGKKFPRALYVGFAWKPDASGFYYAIGKRDAGKRLYYHAMAPAGEDREIFGEGFGPDTWISPLMAETGRYLVIAVQHGWAKGELYFLDLAGGGPPRPLVTGLDARFEPQFAGDYLIVQTDWQAPKSRILKIDLRDPARDKWREVVPAADDAIESFAVTGDKLFVNRLHNVTSRISIYSLEGAPAGEVELPGPGSAGIYGRAGHDEGMFSFSSYTTPYSLYRYSARTGERTLWYRDATPFEPQRFETEQTWYASRDGTRIPMFLIHRKGLRPDGQTPTILYGYGGFNVSITPQFNPTAAWWIEHGGLYAVANIRGGGEFGEAWHRAGMLEKKQNVFDDFIAAGEWLIQNRYTNPQKLAIWGGSNGGLLVGAVLTQRPELFHAVVCWHPDLDMVRYYKYTRNNNPPALLEYGNAADPEQFKFLYAYSPYEHVKPGTKYPAVLITSGDADTRVPPEQARKMAARLQAATRSGLPVMLLYDTKAGHSGGAPLSKTIEDSAYDLTFVAWQLGIATAR
ncbi:MAG TPA: prolyl oligopeptidase family serine peptidase [Bryobacteraceae bacterium]|nr:prolyl oligopeptidase family serine peptidase [Bryobacteraceae bacterium]